MDNRSNARPIYRQIAAMLIGEIQSGKLSDGERLLPERTLARQYGVSVATLRKALAEVGARGMIQRQHGSGNYVRARADMDNRYAFFRLESIGGGGVPDAQVLSVDCQNKKQHDLPDFGVHAQAYRLCRVRALDNIDCAVEEIWLDASCVEAAHATALMTVEHLPPSLYQFYQQDLGLWIVRAEDRVTVAEAPGWCPSSLPFAAGQPVGYVERLAWAQVQAQEKGQEKAVAMEFSRTWYDPVGVRYVSRLK